MARVIAFYGFKGGAGRSYLLANIATMLAAKGKSVLIMDWDLEAPGVGDFFDRPGRESAIFHEWRGKKGLTDIISEQWRGHEWTETTEDEDVVFNSLFGENGQLRAPGISAQESLTAINIPVENSAPIALLGPGTHRQSYDKSEEYLENLIDFDWSQFLGFEGINFLNCLGSALQNEANPYDFVLIDTRTGYNFPSLVAIMRMATDIVVVGTYSMQSIDGLARVRPLLEESGATVHCVLSKKSTASRIPYQDELRKELIKPDFDLPFVEAFQRGDSMFWSSQHVKLEIEEAREAEPPAPGSDWNVPSMELDEKMKSELGDLKSEFLSELVRCANTITGIEFDQEFCYDLLGSFHHEYEKAGSANEPAPETNHFIQQADDSDVSKKFRASRVREVRETVDYIVGDARKLLLTKAKNSDSDVKEIGEKLLDLPLEARALCRHRIADLVEEALEPGKENESSWAAAEKLWRGLELDLLPRRFSKGIDQILEKTALGGTAFQQKVEDFYRAFDSGSEDFVERAKAIYDECLRTEDQDKLAEARYVYGLSLAESLDVGGRSLALKELMPLLSSDQLGSTDWVRPVTDFDVLELLADLVFIRLPPDSTDAATLGQIGAASKRALTTLLERPSPDRSDQWNAIANPYRWADEVQRLAQLAVAIERAQFESGTWDASVHNTSQETREMFFGAVSALKSKLEILETGEPDQLRLYCDLVRAIASLDDMPGAESDSDLEAMLGQLDQNPRVERTLGPGRTFSLAIQAARGGLSKRAWSFARKASNLYWRASGVDDDPYGGLNLCVKLQEQIMQRLTGRSLVEGADPKSARTREVSQFVTRTSALNLEWADVAKCYDFGRYHEAREILEEFADSHVDMIKLGALEGYWQWATAVYARLGDPEKMSVALEHWWPIRSAIWRNNMRANPAVLSEVVDNLMAHNHLKEARQLLDSMTLPKRDAKNSLSLAVKRLIIETRASDSPIDLERQLDGYLDEMRKLNRTQCEAPTDRTFCELVGAEHDGYGTFSGTEMPSIQRIRFAELLSSISLAYMRIGKHERALSQARHVVDDVMLGYLLNEDDSHFLSELRLRCIPIACTCIAIIGAANNDRNLVSRAATLRDEELKINGQSRRVFYSDINELIAEAL